MWILKNSKDLLDNLKSRSFSRVSSIKTFDFSTLYTTLPHDKLKTRLKETIHKAFSHRNDGSKFVVLGYNSTYFSNKIQNGKTCYSTEQECAAIYQLLLHMVFTSWKWFVMQGPVAIILISWNVIFIWETGYRTRAIKRFAIFDLLKSLYSDTKILSKYILSLQTMVNDGFSYSENV